MKRNHSQMTNKYCLALTLLAGTWLGVAVAQGAEIGMAELKLQQETKANPPLAISPVGKKQFDGVDWSGQQFWLVEMSDMLDRDAVTAAWRNLRARFPKQMENRTIIPRRQDRAGIAYDESAIRYQLFIANFPEKQIAEELCALLHAEEQRCSVVSSESFSSGNVLNASVLATDSLASEQVAQGASEAEMEPLRAAQEAEEKARREAEARVAKLKARQEAKAESARQKAEQKAKAEAERQAAAEEKARQLAEAKAEATRVKAEQKAKVQAEKLAAAEARKAAQAEAERVKAEQEAQAAAEAEEKTRQEAEVRVAKLKAKQEAKAKAEAQKLAALEAKKAAQAEAARAKAEQKAKAQAEKLAAAETKKTEAAVMKPEREVQTKAQAENLALAENRQATANELQLKAEQGTQVAAAEKKTGVEDLAAAKMKSPEGTMEDFAQNVERQKTEQKNQAEANVAEEAKAEKLKAAKSDMLVDFVQKAVLNNPDVLTRWHNFQAAVSETAAAEGGFYPQLDVTVDGGRERGMSTGSSYSVNTKTGSVTLTQLLYDGFATLNEVRRLNNAQLSRYYELLDASETAALEAARAFYDVSRQRKLFELTEDNYVRHRTAFEQIKLKVEAGVGRRVDLEQAAGRLALSESNLTLDNANVHDASARFQRIIGELPPAKIRKSPSQAKLAKKILPNAADALLSVAVESHPAILAAVENVRSSRYDLYGREAKYQPTVKLNITQSHSKNMAGVDGTTGNASAKIMLNWNLFSGGSDSARSAQYAKKLDAARDMRDKACRDIRMNLAIAYNDISKLKEQLNYMDQHQLSIEKARVAYQKQFEIGQRSLLDLLDTENELYQARRSYNNAEYDLAIAAARTLAGMGQLVSSLEISRLETADLPELLGVSSDAAENCPPEAPIANNIRKDELDARAIEEARAVVEAARVKEAAEKEKKEAEDKEFLMTPGEIKAEKSKKEQDPKVAEDKAKQAAGAGSPDVVDARKPPETAAKQPEQQARIPSTMQEFKEQGAEPGNGKSFKDCPNCPEMVMVPAGQFMMGAPGSQKQKTISDAFAVGKYEVTFAEWDACVAGGGCAKYRPNDQGWGRGRQPVVNVNWNDAKKYVRWLSQKTGKNYRLLTETEWEYAARAGTTTAYPWGDTIGSGNANCNGCGSQWDNKQPAPVGSFKANAFGIYDMNGNVCEWTEDCINNNNCNVRIVRGGSWFYGAPDVISAHRVGDDSNARDYDDGLRVARELP